MENWHLPYSRGRFCAATAGEHALPPREGWAAHGIVRKAPISCAKVPGRNHFFALRSRPETDGEWIGGLKREGYAMTNFENGNAGSESWDPALWSIGTVLGVAIVYLACLG